MAETDNKRAPVQGFSAGIPWSMHLRAYDAYCMEYGSQKALIDLEGRNCRGGFSTDELDVFIPGWREEVNENQQLRQRIAALMERIAALETELAQERADKERISRYVMSLEEAAKPQKG